MDNEVDYSQVDLDQLAQEMATYAKDELGFLGAAVLSLETIVNRDAGEVASKIGEYATRLSRTPSRGPEDKGTNYVGMAEGKRARRLREELGIDLKEPTPRRGEPEVTGDSAEWLGEVLLVIAAYSGAPKPEQDQIITDWGISKFREHTTKQVKDE